MVTLGCSKNTVDSEVLLRQIAGNGFTLVAEPAEADVVIVNTCGFIDAAKEESVNAILEAAAMKSRGDIRTLYVAGCLSERYRTELSAELPEVDRFFGVTDYAAILEALGGDLRRELLGERLLTTPSHTAYLKISEGCDRPCAFCAIPLMRGGHVSRPREEIVAEARRLAAAGVRELVVIGQDTTMYGLDLSGARGLAPLLDALADVEGIGWIRLMYAYPAHFPLDVLPVLRDRDTVCAYLDMPVQHIDDGVLRSMRRGITARATVDLIDRIRTDVPGIALRTTLIVGYPNESAAAFDALHRFVEETAFDRLGVFAYSAEEGTAAALLGDPLPPEEKERRRAAIMELQAGMSARRNRERIGRTETVLFDRVEGSYAVGRTERDAPEVDNEVLVACDGQSGMPLIGTFARVTITAAGEFDLFGVLAE